MLEQRGTADHATTSAELVQAVEYLDSIPDLNSLDGELPLTKANILFRLPENKPWERIHKLVQKAILQADKFTKLVNSKHIPAVFHDVANHKEINECWELVTSKGIPASFQQILQYEKSKIGGTVQDTSLAARVFESKYYLRRGNADSALKYSKQALAIRPTGAVHIEIASAYLVKYGDYESNPPRLRKDTPEDDIQQVRSHFNAVLQAFKESTNGIDFPPFATPRDYYVALHNLAVIHALDIGRKPEEEKERLRTPGMAYLIDSLEFGGKPAFKFLIEDADLSALFGDNKLKPESDNIDSWKNFLCAGSDLNCKKKVENAYQSSPGWWKTIDPIIATSSVRPL